MDRSRVGIIGAGQLGRMMALAGYPLGIECRFVDTSAQMPAGQVAPMEAAALDDPDALQRLASAVDVVTFDIENVSVDALEQLSAAIEVLPQPKIVAIAQDRLEEKRLFQSMAIPTAAFVTIDEPADLDRAAAELSWPLVLKARRLGYDGRGQRIVSNRRELGAAWEAIGQVPSIAEAWVEFDTEVSLIGVRSASQGPLFYPLTENEHRGGILVRSIAPVENADLQATAESWLEAIMARFDYRGVLTVEFFNTAGGLVANEMAPRVHNSGHWTIEGAETSQFENHLRAVLDLPLGRCEARGYAGMVNLLGQIPDCTQVLNLPGAHLHNYGKTPRPARKLGHCTMVDLDKARLIERLRPLQRLADAANSESGARNSPGFVLG
jgi:5-(carboxyamino)imidazole ribonucleotide synthase